MNRVKRIFIGNNGLTSLLTRDNKRAIQKLEDKSLNHSTFNYVIPSNNFLQR